MSKRILRVIFMTAGLVAVGGLAIASEPYLPRAQKAFDRLDANKDDAVSAAEIDASLQAAMERRRNRILSSLDADKNGSITRAELNKYVEAMVAGADTDSDGGVSFDEARIFKIAKWRKALQPASSN